MKNVRCSCVCSCAPKLGQTFPTSFSQRFAPINPTEWCLPPEQYIYGAYFWTDGTHIYYSDGANKQYVLDNGTWKTKEWGGRPPFGNNIWSDGANIYYSDFMLDNSYVLNGDTWEVKDWGDTVPNGVNGKVTASCIWTDGENIYHTCYNITYFFTGETWRKHNWYGTPPRDGARIWTDGNYIYNSDGASQYVLNGNTWETKTWYGDAVEIDGHYIWTDGKNIYCSYYASKDNWEDTPIHYVLKNNAWEKKKNIIGERGDYVWTDNTNIFFSNISNQFLLLPSTAKLYTKVNDRWVGPCSIT